MTTTTEPTATDTADALEQAIEQARKVETAAFRRLIETETAHRESRSHATLQIWREAQTDSRAAAARRYALEQADKLRPKKNSAGGGQPSPA